MGHLPYTISSFEEIANKESRRGKNLGKLSPEIFTAIKDISEHKSRFRENEVFKGINEIDTPVSQDESEKCQEKLNELRQVRDSAIRSLLEDVHGKFEQVLEKDDFRFGLKKHSSIKGRDIYSFSDDLSISYPEKQAALVVKELIFAHSPGRNSIIRVLKECLSRTCGYEVYRTDISQYYESIPHNLLLKELKKHRKFDPITEKLVRQLLAEYQAIKETEDSENQKSCGVPAGVSLASQLAEFYLRDFDRMVKTKSDVWFYARYVDDIILVADEEKIEKIKEDIQQTLKSEKGLDINEKKTQTIHAPKEGVFERGKKIEYLGYEFKREKYEVSSNGENKKYKIKLVTELTQKRLKARISRIEAAFCVWSEGTPNPDNPNGKKDQLLIQRLRFLAGNCRLQNSKSNVSVGLYFSNVALDDDAESLRIMDCRLTELITEHEKGMSEKLKVKLKKISFVKMFKDRSFFRFNQSQLKAITSCWIDDE